MRVAAPVYQLYRLDSDTTLWWRLVSPNGRSLARSVHPGTDVDVVRASIVLVQSSIARLEPVLRPNERARWRWTLSLDGDPVAQSLHDIDRRVRCEHACRTFMELAPTAMIDPLVHDFRAGSLARPGPQRLVE